MDSTGLCSSDDRARNSLEFEVFEMLIRSFNFRNLINVFETDRSQYFVPRFGGTLLYAGSFLYEVSGGRCFGDEVESAVGFNSNERRRGCTGFNMSCSCIELFAEVHRLNTTSTESWSNWWCGSRFARTDQKTLPKMGSVVG